MTNYKCIFVAVILSLVMNVVFCQTFQYSRGWTNGKRSETPNSAEISNSIDEGFTTNELKRLKMLVHGNTDEQQPLLIYCELMDKLRKLMHTGNYIFQLRREKGQNDDNY